MKIYAHRGFSYKYPEATRAAYQGAIEVGADGFECDVRLTKDGIAVCFHDRDTNRIASVRRSVASLTLEELRGITEVMTLEELLELTNHENPIVIKHDVIHYGVPNIPSGFARTASQAISNVLMPLLIQIGDVGGLEEIIWH